MVFLQYFYDLWYFYVVYIKKLLKILMVNFYLHKQRKKITSTKKSLKNLPPKTPKKIKKIYDNFLFPKKTEKNKNFIFF